MDWQESSDRGNSIQIPETVYQVQKLTNDSFKGELECWSRIQIARKFGELLNNFEEMCFNKDLQPRFLKAASRCLGIWYSTLVFDEGFFLYGTD